MDRFEVSDEDIRVCDISLGDVVLNVLVQGGRVSLVFLEDHLFGGKPGNGGPSNVPLLEVFIELGDKVWVSS